VKTSLVTFFWNPAWHIKAGLAHFESRSNFLSTKEVELRTHAVSNLIHLGNSVLKTHLCGRKPGLGENLPQLLTYE